MFFGNKRRIVSLLLAGCLLYTAEFQVFAADPQSEAQTMETVTYDIEVAALDAIWDQIPVMASVAVNTQEWYGKALANGDAELSVYDAVNGNVIGIMYNNTVVTIVQEEAEWCLIQSGSVQGYVKTNSLLFGSAAVERAQTACANGTQDAKTNEQIQAEEAAKRSAAEVKLLAALIYCEAGNQPYQGQVAVGSVVLNRMNSSRYPGTLEGVIYQRGQFTPARSGKLARVLASGRIPASCYDAAMEAMAGAKPLGNVLFFNTGYGKYKLGDHYFS